MCKLKELVKNCFEGELILPKPTIWLIGAVCLLAGVVYGLKTAPLTHGMMIGSNNGNNNGNNSGNGHKEEKEEKEEKSVNEADAECQRRKKG